MCHECIKEFKGWCKSFTKTEILLVILEAILLVICVGFIVFLVIHMIVCDNGVEVHKMITISETPDKNIDSRQSSESPLTTRKCTAAGGTPKPEVKCTWEPSKKTAATTHYYLDEETREAATKTSTTPSRNLSDLLESAGKLELTGAEILVLDDQSDGEEADEVYNSLVLALVKLRPPGDVTFGCILTVVSEYWTVTAASCIKAIEEVDSLDSYVMMEGYGGGARGAARAVAAVRVHPRWRGGGGRWGWDVAALRSAGRLAGAAARLPTLLDYFVLTVGERFTILGFGGFRTPGAGPGARRLRGVEVYSLGGAACGAGAAGGAGALCAGVRWARGAACAYCAGTPLLRARLLLGVRGGGARACEPALYVNVAQVRDWLQMLFDPD